MKGQRCWQLVLRDHAIADLAANSAENTPKTFIGMLAALRASQRNAPRVIQGETTCLHPIQCHYLRLSKPQTTHTCFMCIVAGESVIVLETLKTLWCLCRWSAALSNLQGGAVTVNVASQFGAGALSGAQPARGTTVLCVRRDDQVISDHARFRSVMYLLSH